MTYPMNVIIGLASAGIHGFESPAAGYQEKALSLNNLIVSHPSATVFAEVTDDAMTGLGLFTGDLLVVDKSLTATRGDVVLALVDGETVCRQLDHHQLHANTNAHYSEISVTDGIEIQGVAICSVRFHRRKRDPLVLKSLDDLLIESTFVGRARGESMTGVGIHSGDILIVSRQLTAGSGDVIIAIYENEFVCKVLDLTNSRLLSANDDFEPVLIKPDDRFWCEGVVPASIRLLKQPSLLL
ncbi:phage repressor (plasmid) [Shewanella putrefaciens]|nr:phage repressor [Shewanella putrefaciens]